MMSGTMPVNGTGPGVDSGMLATIVDRDAVEVTGRDAAAYLQGQISQDVDSIAAGASAWSLILAPSGRLAAWFRLHRVGEARFFIDVESNWAAPLVERLERFKLRTAVDFQILEGWRMLSLRNHDADSKSPDSAESGRTIQATLSAVVRWPGLAGTDHLGKGLAVPAGVEVDDAAFEQARILAGLPRLGLDMGENTIPAEGGARLIEASVSFSKGCYTGQELVARIDSRGGNVPRPLRVLIAEQTPEVGAVVTCDGAEVGVVTSAAGSVAMAPLMRKVTPGMSVSIHGISAIVQEPA